MTVPPVTPQQPGQPSSSSGCLKWGLIGCALIIVLGVLSIVALGAFVLGILKSNNVYKEAKNRVVHDQRVIAALGAPVETGWWVRGTINYKNTRGDADFEFPVHGPKGKATVHAVAEKKGDQWYFTQLDVTPDTGPPIDLVEETTGNQT